MPNRLLLALLIFPICAQAEWRHAVSAPAVTETKTLATNPLLLGLLLFALLFLLSIMASVLLLFVYSNLWAWIALVAYTLLSLLNIVFSSKASRLFGVQKELGLGYSTALWVFSSLVQGFLFLVAGFASGIIWLSGLGIFALLLAFGLIFLAQKRSDQAFY